MIDKEYREFISLINEKFLKEYNTVLVGGFTEPFYQSFKNGKLAQIQYTKNYFRSALHELAHWCVAGVQRRELDDYGYWYAEDGRNQQQQDEFFKVEVKPQTIEWAFSIVAGVEFEASVDNLNNQVLGVDKFKQSLKSLMIEYLKNDFPPRVSKILQLMSSYKNINDYKKNISIALNS
jgi:elongation factor P hydroxylase